MAELSVAGQTAMSYLEDVEHATDELDRNTNHLIRESDGLKLISGDLQLARNEIYDAEPDERNFLEGLCYYREGMILWSIASGHSKYYSLGGEEKRKTHEFTASAGEAFSKAVNTDPKPLYQYYLGVIYKMTDRKAEAIQMFELAAKGDNPKIAVESRKEIGRIGPISTEPASVPAILTPQTPAPTPEIIAVSEIAASPVDINAENTPSHSAAPAPTGNSSKNGCAVAFVLISLLIVAFAMFSGQNNNRYTYTTPPISVPSPAQSARTNVPNSTTKGLPTQVTSKTSNSNGVKMEGERFPQTRTRYLSRSEIENWSFADVRYALNEIYARHGYPFKTMAIRKRFEQFSWYRPVSGRNQPQIERLLSSSEKANMLLLAQKRNEMTMILGE